MNQSSKNITLLVILGLLVLTSIILGLTRGDRRNTIGNKHVFSVRDTSQVDLISITSGEEEVRLKKVDETWRVNETYNAEPNIIKILLAVLKDIEAVRSVPNIQKKELSQYLSKNGSLVEISGDGKPIKTFYVAGNENKTLTYMTLRKDDVPMVVNIPGYQSYVAGIFEIPANDWRDRLILSTNWRTLQTLTINYLQYPEHNVHIHFEFDFLKVDGVTTLDTTKMMTFIEEFNFLQADSYLDKGQHSQYDSLYKTPSTVTVSVKDIQSKNSKTIDFFPLLSKDRMMLAYVKEDDQMVLFEANRIQNLFAVRSDFEFTPNDHSVP